MIGCSNCVHDREGIIYTDGWICESYECGEHCGKCFMLYSYSNCFYILIGVYFRTG